MEELSVLVSRRAPVYAIDRRHVILQRVADDGAIHVAALAQELAVSEMTIRRDIRRLEHDGFVRQTYGGATAHLTRSFDLSFNARALEHSREKRLIALAAARLIGDVRSLFIGIGTTAEHFARALAARPDTMVVTASIPIASVLGSRPMRTVLLGGSVLRDELSCIGPAASATLARYRFEVAVIGAAGVDSGAGITELTDEEAEIQRLALARSERVIVIADGSKIGRKEMASVAPADRIGTLVTDATAPPGELEALRALGIDAVVVGGPPDERPSRSTTVGTGEARVGRTVASDARRR